MAFELLQIKYEPDDQLIGLLESNVIGTPGEGMLYQHADVSKKVRSIKEPIFCNLSIRNKLYGTIAFCRRTVLNLGIERPGYYLRYFTFLEKFRSGQKNNRRGKQSRIREEVAMLMDGEGLKDQENAILYAYVDPENTRSKRLIEEFGFKNVGSFHTIPFSRMLPRIKATICKLTSIELSKFMNQLERFYVDHQLVSFDNLVGRGEYFVIKQDDEVICGVQGILDSWKILKLPGFSGKIMMNLVPYIPGLNRLFNPDYKFVFLDHIYFKAGHEHQLSNLFETVLKHFKAYSGILCMDPKSDVYKRIRQLNFGITHKIMDEKKIEIFVKSRRPWRKNEGDPFFISGYDVL